MTRKDYSALAATLREYNFKVADPVITEVVADLLQHTFPNFDRDKFVEEARRNTSQERLAV